MHRTILKNIAFFLAGRRKKHMAILLVVVSALLMLFDGVDDKTSCAHYSLKWPIEHYQIIINNRPGNARAFQAHHIVPINAGGVNCWWNLSPISDKNHHELHASIEEHACFSHNFIEQKSCRLLLKIKEVFYKLSGCTTRINGFALKLQGMPTIIATLRRNQH